MPHTSLFPLCAVLVLGLVVALGLSDERFRFLDPVAVSQWR